MSSLVWDSYKLESSVQKFSDAIYNFREKIDELISVENNIDQQLKELEGCPYDESKFSEILYEIQKSIDYLNLKGFSNLPQWVARLDEEIEKKFANRLLIAIKIWVDVLIDRRGSSNVSPDADSDNVIVVRRRNQVGSTSHTGGLIDQFNKFMSFEDNMSDITMLSAQSNSDIMTQSATTSNTNSDSEAHAAMVARMGGQPQIKPIVLEILIRNQLLYVLPSIEDAREHLISQLEEFSSVITTQKRIQHSRYQVSMEAESEYKVTYKNLLNKFPNGIKLLEYAFAAVDFMLQQANDYVKIWLHFQSLWDLQPETLYSRLGKFKID